MFTYWKCRNEFDATTKPNKMGTENKIRFTQKIAKQLAQKQFNWMIGCLLGTDDPDYSLTTPIEEIEQNLEEGLKEIGINPTTKRVADISRHYSAMTEKVIRYLEKLSKPICFKDIKTKEDGKRNKI